MNYKEESSRVKRARYVAVLHRIPRLSIVPSITLNDLVVIFHLSFLYSKFRTFTPTFPTVYRYIYIHTPLPPLSNPPNKQTKEKEIQHSTYNI